MLHLLHDLIDELAGMLVPLAGEVEVEHGGVERSVSEVLLDKSEADASFKQVGSIAVSESVRGDAFLDSELSDGASQSVLDNSLVHGSS